MAIIYKYKSLDKEYDNTERRFLVSDYRHDGDEGLVVLRSKLMTTYNDDIVSTTPSCDCGHYNKSYFEDHVCPECGYKCISTFSDFSAEMFLVAFDNVGKWVNPVFIGVLNSNVSTKVRLVRWIMDPKYNPPLGTSKALFTSFHNIKGFERTYVWFINNIEVILDFLIVSTALKQSKDKIEAIKIIKTIYLEDKEVILSTHLPLLNKKMFVMVNTNGMGKYGNSGIGNSLDMALDYLKGFKTTSSKARSIIMAKILDKDTQLYDLIVSKFYKGRGGILRKNLHGARLPFSARAVIVPRIGKHKPEDVILPWGIGVTMLRPHILPKLMRLGYTYLEASVLLFTSVKKFNADIYTILCELVDSSDNGIKVKFQRNPSLEMGSSTLQNVIEFKKDVEDTSAEISSLLAKLFSGDFDGDEENIMLILDKKMYNMFKSFAPHNSVTSTNIPHEVSNRITLTDPGVSLVSNGIRHQRIAAGLDK